MVGAAVVLRGRGRNASLADVLEWNTTVGGRCSIGDVEVVESATVLVRRRKELIGVESAVWVTIGVLTGRWQQREPGQGRAPMPILKCHRRIRRQAHQQRDATLAPKDVGTVRRGTGSHRGFLSLCHRLRLRLTIARRWTSAAHWVLVHPTGRCFVCRRFFVGGSSGPSLLLGRMNFLGGIVAAWGRQRGGGGDEARRQLAARSGGSGGRLVGTAHTGGPDCFLVFL
jgi:hypothetical protein